MITYSTQKSSGENSLDLQRDEHAVHGNGRLFAGLARLQPQAFYCNYRWVCLCRRRRRRKCSMRGGRPLAHADITKASNAL